MLLAQSAGTFKEVICGHRKPQRFLSFHEYPIRSERQAHPDSGRSNLIPKPSSASLDVKRCGMPAVSVRTSRKR